MKEKREGVEALVQELIKKGIMRLNNDEIEKHAGKLSKEVRTQLDALMKSDGCWCPHDPPGCKC